MKTGFNGVASTVMAALICAAFASCTALGPGSPDLMVASPTVSDDGPAAGAPFTLSAAVRNGGDGASASTTLRYYRSTDAEISSFDTEVGTDAVEELAASATSSQSVSLTAPTMQARTTTVHAWTRWRASPTRPTIARHRCRSRYRSRSPARIWR